MNPSAEKAIRGALAAARAVGDAAGIAIAELLSLALSLEEEERLRLAADAERAKVSGFRNGLRAIARRFRGIIVERDGTSCLYCGAEADLTIDHVVPLSRGGTNAVDNLVLACRPCNSSKGDRLLEEWKPS